MPCSLWMMFCHKHGLNSSASFHVTPKDCFTTLMQATVDTYILEITMLALLRVLAQCISPMVRMTTLRVLFALTAALDLELFQMDVKTAFLHGDLDKELYMKQPEGYAILGKQHLVCKLKSSFHKKFLYQYKKFEPMFEHKCWFPFPCFQLAYQMLWWSGISH